jgi:hypothetical protein
MVRAHQARYRCDYVDTDQYAIPISSIEALRLLLTRQEVGMLYTLAVILLIAWLLGVVGTYTIGAFVHVLLVVAIVLFLVGLLSGRRTVV